MKDFKTKYGRFSPDGKEYIVTTPRTPRPWINVISNGDYGFVVSQTGSGYSWRTHAQLNRITRWEQDLIKDEWGKYLYLRDENGNIWSAGWKPVCAEPAAYSCRHGVGYTAIESRNFGIDSSLLMFAPNEAPLELWILRIHNRSRRKRTINLFSYFEWGLGQAPDWHREFHKSFIRTAYDRKARTILATKRLWEVPTDRGHWNTDWPYVAFHSSDRAPASFETDKESFLGMYGNQARPQAVKAGRLSGKSGNWLDPCASLHHRVTLDPGEEAEIVYALGCAKTESEALDLSRRYSSVANARTAFDEMTDRWNSLLGSLSVATPDPAMDLMENVWLKYQAISGRMWGRTAYYQTGGAYGFRDQLQDSQLWLPIEPERTREQLRLHAHHQFLDGTVQHWWHPLSEVGLHNNISDNLLWLPFVLARYLEETGDPTVLDDRERWVDNAGTASLYDHALRAVDRALDRFSERGLPLIGDGDWNDGLSAVGLGMKGESVWLGHFLHSILLDFVPIAEAKGDRENADRFTARAAKLRENLNVLAWDGEYYFGATKDSGELLGSHLNAEGSVWLNPQTWAIIGRVAGAERAQQVFDVVEKRLETAIGTLLLTPAYATPDREVGYLTRYSPGMRENGGVYTHAATWAVVAATMLGRGGSAFRMYSKLNPIVRAKNPDRYCAEPYATAGNIEGPESAFFGRGGWTWYSGSAAWLFKAALEYILGVRGTREGLLIDPCIPAQWKGFSVIRRFRGAEYRIHVENPDRVECGVREIRVDGRACAEAMGPREKRLPAFEAGTVHTVAVVLGKRD